MQATRQIYEPMPLQSTKADELFCLRFRVVSLFSETFREGFLHLALMQSEAEAAPTSIAQRKADHLALCATDEIAFRHQTTLMEQVRFLHDALPELDADAVDTSCTLFGKRLAAPIIIAAMTGGTQQAAEINVQLAGIAEELGLGFGLGSQRAMVVRPDAATRRSFCVRDVAPKTLVLGNIGVVQARAMSTHELASLVSDVGADALCIHLNPAMELIQPGGDRDFRGGLDTIARAIGELAVPVIVKETGCGLSRAVGQRLRSIGASHVDTSGAGGTSWVAVETKRAEAAGDALASALGHALWDWGIPTAASVAMLAPLGFDTIIATGGIASGLDVARAVALGASAAGIARPVLKALTHHGRGAAVEVLEQAIAQLRAIMVLTGSPNLSHLRKAPLLLGPELRAWLDDERAQAR